MNNQTIKDLNSFSDKVFFKLQEKAPEILLGTSIALTAAAVGTGIYGSFKTVDTISDYESKVSALKASIKDDNDLKKEIAKEKRHLIRKTVVNYIPCFACTAGSILSNYGDYKVQKATNKKLIASLTALNAFTTAYRKRVVDELGEDADFRFATGTSKKPTKMEITNPDGTTEKVELPVVEKWEESMYTRKWSSSTRYEFDPYYNTCTLSALQKDVNNDCRNKGFIWFNEILTKYGYGECSYGHDYGKIYDPDNPIIVRCKEVVIKDPESGRWAKDYILFFDGMEYIKDKVYKERKGLITNQVLLDGEDPDEVPF